MRNGAAEAETDTSKITAAAVLVVVEAVLVEWGHRDKK